MLIGVSLNLKDRRVDKMLRSIGITGVDIYYSPIGTWLINWLLLLPTAWGLIYLLASTAFVFLLILYLIVSYLLNARRNNSFTLYEDKFIVVNPNFPFRQMVTIDIKDIELITIDEGKQKWIQSFMVFGENYLLVQTKDNTLKFYCSGLELDAFDENLTERTIEDLDAKLKTKGISTDFKVTYA